MASASRSQPELHIVSDLPPSTRQITAELLAGIREVFAERLIGVYAYGSAIYGDFDPGVSDLDLCTLLTADADATDLHALGILHDRIAARHPGWAGRVEVQYVSTMSLAGFRTRRHRMINISPGEPIHFIEAGIEWLVNWYFILDHGVTLSGPAAATVFPRISQDEFVTAARDLALDFLSRIANISGSQAQSYAILTVARALFTHRSGDHVSKIRAATWLSGEFPDWKPAVDDAVRWRSIPAFESPKTVERARSIVRSVVAMIERERRDRPGIPVRDDRDKTNP